MDSAPFSSVSTSSQQIQKSTAQAYDLLDKTVRDENRQTLIHSEDPPYSKNNAEYLEGALILDKIDQGAGGEKRVKISRESVEQRLRVTEGLSAYAKALAGLASAPDWAQWDKSVDEVAKSLKAFDAASAGKLFDATLKLAPADVDAFAGAVRLLGQQILIAKQKAALEKILAAGSGPVKTITDRLAEDIGDHPSGQAPRGLRGYFYLHYGSELVDTAGQAEAWKKAGDAEREKIVNAAYRLADQRRQTDAMLSALRESYLTFYQAHEALRTALENGGKLPRESAVEELGALAQRLETDSKNLADITSAK